MLFVQRMLAVCYLYRLCWQCVIWIEGAGSVFSYRGCCQFVICIDPAVMQCVICTEGAGTVLCVQKVLAGCYLYRECW